MRMTSKRAREIVAACVANGLYHILGDMGREVPSLAGLSLGEMVEANRLVKGMCDGGVIYMTCDDRLLAALYVAQHFPGHPGDNPDPVCLLPDGRAVVVLDLREAFRRTPSEA